MFAPGLRARHSDFRIGRPACAGYPVGRIDASAAFIATRESVAQSREDKTMPKFTTDNVFYGG